MSLGGRFRRFWWACVLADVGDGIRLAALPLLAVSLSADPLVVSAIAAAGAAPWLLTGLLAGALADRCSRRALVVTADVTRTAVLGALVAVLLTGRATVPLVACAALLLGIGETVRDTAAQALVPHLVPEPQLERANGRLVAAEITGNEFVGPLVGGALFGLGAAVPFIVDSAALVFAVALLISLPETVVALRDLSADAGAAVPGGVRAGLRWLSRQPVLRALLVVGTATAVADSTWFAVFVLYAVRVLGLSATAFGALLAAGAGGGLAGAFATDRLIAGRRHRAVLVAAVAGTGSTPLLLVVAPRTWAAAVVVVLTSAAFGVFNVAAVSLRQRLVPDGLLGRVTAAWRTLAYGGSAVGALGGGALASAGGVEWPFLFSALLGTVAAAVWWLVSRPLRAAWG